MNKNLIALGIICLFFIGLCGCTSEDLLPPSIISFNVTPGIIYEGDTANLSWEVTNAETIMIDNGIGSVSLIGTYIIQPNETTTYKIIATDGVTTVNATTQIIVQTVTPEPQSTPSLAWTTDDSDNTLTFSSGSQEHNYASTSTDGNLIFKLDTVEYYVKNDFTLTSTQTGLYIGAINAGDNITGFTAGTYQLIWEPTDKLLGSITYT